MSLSATRPRTLTFCAAGLFILTLLMLWNHAGLDERIKTTASTREAPKPKPPENPPAAPVAPACNVKITAAPWSKRGRPPDGAGIVGWLDNKLVEIDERSRAVIAHVFDPTNESWRAVRLPAAEATFYYKLTATLNAAVYTPMPFRDDEGSVGGVFDPHTGAWRKPAARLPLHGWASYSTVSSDHWVLFYSDNFRSSSSTHRVLFNPETREVIEVPAPPFSDPRANAVVALDDDNLVVWGGFQGDNSHYAARLFDDGAVFRIKERRWDSIPKGPSARSEPVFDLHDGKLMIFGGVDAIRSDQQPSWPARSRDDLVTGAYVLDLASLRWQSVAYDWTHWARDPLLTDLTPCWSCSPTLQLRSGSFFAGGLLYDAKSQVIQRVTPVASPASWPRGEAGSREVLALDDDHVIMTERGTNDALVLDLRTRSWCSATLPVGSFDAAGEDSAFYGLNTSTHGGRLYFWRSSSRHAILVPLPCSGAEPRVGCDLVVTPANGVVVTFAWE